MLGTVHGFLAGRHAHAHANARYTSRARPETQSKGPGAHETRGNRVDVRCTDTRRRSNRT
eukprot:12826486-Alexandrium_andersonii.AAC.1